MHWRRKWQPTPVFLPGESQGWGAWWAAIFGVAQSRTQLKRLSSSRVWNQIRPERVAAGIVDGWKEETTKVHKKTLGGNVHYVDHGNDFHKCIQISGLPRWRWWYRTCLPMLRSLGPEGPLGEGMATHSSILVWGIPWTEEPGGLHSPGLQRVGHNWSDLVCTHTYV